MLCLYIWNIAALLSVEENLASSHSLPLSLSHPLPLSLSPSLPLSLSSPSISLIISTCSSSIPQWQTVLKGDMLQRLCNDHLGLRVDSRR